MRVVVSSARSYACVKERNHTPCEVAEQSRTEQSGERRNVIVKGFVRKLRVMQCWGSRVVIAVGRA